MGLFGLFSIGPKTQSDWDKETIRLTKKLEDEKLSLRTQKRRLRGSSNYAYAISYPERRVRDAKVALAEARIKRRSAPKG